MYFVTQASSSTLQFSAVLWGTTVYYYVPQGTEDTLFGNGVILQVTLSWNNGTGQLSLNNTTVKTFTYTAPTPNWTAASILDIGAYEYSTYGGYNILDDLIDEFTVGTP